MDRAHTKGPWARDHFDELRGEDGSLVRFRGMANILAGSETAIARAKANTLLADAAPDMFEALLQARGWVSAEPQLAIIDAALAKAEGRANLADATPNPSPAQEG